MVRNTTGGSGHKSQARKLVSGGRSSKLRLSENENERYAYVIKNLGNGMCHITSDEGDTILCHIRGKFRGRNKSNNIVAVSSIVLVGMREWESTKKNCDLLEVYDIGDVRILRSTPSVSNRMLDLDKYVGEKMGSTKQNTTNEEFAFSNDAEMQPFHSVKISGIKEESGSEDELFTNMDTQLKEPFDLVDFEDI